MTRISSAFGNDNEPLAAPAVGSRPQKEGARKPPLLAVLLLAIVVAASASSTARAATPAGPEFRVNSAVADSQSLARGTRRGRSVARGGSATIVVWQSALQDGSGFGVYAQRYNPTGLRVGGEFPVNSTTAGDQALPGVDLDTGGNFAVAWAGSGPGDTQGIFARAYDAAGNARGGEIAVNTTTAGTQDDPDLAMDNGGAFVVVWCGAGPGDPAGIVARHFNSNGNPASAEILVNSDTTGVQSHPNITSDSNGDFVVVWESPGPSGDHDIYFRRFDSNGTPQGSQGLVNAITAGEQRHPAVSRASNGNFVVAWETDVGPGDTDIHMRRMSGSGFPLAAETLVHGASSSVQKDPCLQLDTGGEYVVGWTSDDDPTAGVDWNVRVQQFSKDGFAVGTEEVANSTLAGNQSAASVALDALEQFVIVWEGNGSGDADGVFGRRYGLQANVDIGLVMTTSNPNPREGDTLLLTLTVVNHGPDIATNVNITAPLPAGLTYVSDIATQGNWSSSTGVWQISSMAVQSTDVLQRTVRVDTGTAGLTLTCVASLSSLGQPDPVASNNVATLDVTPQRHLLRLSASQSGSTLLPGQAPVPVYRLLVVNASTAAETLLTLDGTNNTSGPGTPAERDAEWEALTLGVEGGSTLATAAFNAGRAHFGSWSLPIAAGDSVTLVLRGAPSLAARDGDVLDLHLDATDLGHSGVSTIQVSGSLDPAGSFLVNGMSAAQITVHEVPASTFFAGTARNLAFDITLPANGYSPDVLEKLNLFNHGTAAHGSDIEVLQAWVDDGNGRFQDGEERLLGTLVFTGNRWELTGLAETVPVGGLRVFFTVSLGAGAGLGRTIRLGLSGDPDIPIGMASGNDGPVDGSVANRFSQSVSTADRVVLSAVALETRPVRPSTQSFLLLQLSGTNSYPAEKTLTELALTNVATSANGGSTAQLDASLEQLQLVDDSNNNGFLEGSDAVLASSFLSGGRAFFEGLTWTLSAGASRSLFVVGAVALQGAADGDELGAQVVGALDVTFLDPTSVVASWPLDSTGRGRVDGMVAAQLTNYGAAGVTLGPNEGPALALDLGLPRNGYADDVLRGLSLVENGSATAADLADVRLWRDGGDGAFTPGSGDDAEIAPLVFVDGLWKSPQLATPIGASGLRLFVGVTVAGAPADSATVQFGVPLDGIQTASGNDGPVDEAVANSEAMLLSTAPLSVSLVVAVPRSNVGQDFLVRMTVRNVGDETILGVKPSALSMLGDAAALLMAPPVPASATLLPDSEVTFQWTYKGTAVGSLQFVGEAEGTGAAGGPVRRSLPDRSGALRLLLRATSMGVLPVGNVPFSINRGETGVVPLSLTFSHDGDSNTSDILLRHMRLRVEDDTGAGIVPAAILAQLAVREGSRTYYASTALPTSGAVIDLDLAPALRITPDEPSTVSFQCDILPTTTVPVFRLVLLDATAFVAEDATEGTPVTVHPAPGSFPIQSGTGQVRSAPVELDVATLPATPQRIGRGQTQVALLGLRLSNPGVPNVTTNVRVGAFECSIVDAAGNTLPLPGSAFQSLRIKSGALTLEERSLVSSTDPFVTFTLSIPALVPAGADNDLVILGDVAPGAPLGAYRLRLGSPASIDARDDNTHAPVPVVYATTPLEGSAVTIEAPAESLRLAGTPSFPPGFIVGDTGRTALVASLRHPGAPGVGRIRVERLSVLCLDEARRSLSSAAYLDRLSFWLGAQEIAQASQFPPTGGFDVPLTDFFLEPGQTVALTVKVDVEATAPATFFELLLPAVTAFDANLGGSVQVQPENGAELPLTSGLTKLGPPATDLAVGLESRIPAVLSPDGSMVLLARLSLRNTAVQGSGSIEVQRLVCRAADRGLQAIALGAAASQLVLLLDGNVLAASGTLGTDSVTVSFTLPTPLRVDAGVTALVDVQAAFRGDSGLDGFRLGVGSDDVQILQPSGSLGVRVQAEPGQAFPLWTEAGGFAVASLGESFANFPNPFGPGRESTTFTYYLPQAGRVTLRILSPRGEAVATVVENADRTAGLHQSDLWSGANGHDRLVTNGVYIAALEVQHPDGSRERVLRKVAVVR